MAKASRGKSQRRPASPARPARPAKSSKTWDPANSPPRSAAPSLAEQEQKNYHPTHFTADPRGAAMAGSPPGAKQPPRRKRRGGSGPA